MKFSEVKIQVLDSVKKMRPATSLEVAFESSIIHFLSDWMTEEEEDSIPENGYLNTMVKIVESGRVDNVDIDKKKMKDWAEYKIKDARVDSEKRYLEILRNK